MQSWWRPECGQYGPNNLLYASILINCFIIYCILRYVRSLTKPFLPAFLHYSFLPSILLLVLFYGIRNFFLFSILIYFLLPSHLISLFPLSSPFLCLLLLSYFLFSLLPIVLFLWYRFGLSSLQNYLMTWASRDLSPITLLPPAASIKTR